MASARNTRRRHSKAFKAQVIAQCARPGISIAQIAMSHGLNASMVRRWRRFAECHPPAKASVSSGGEFISLPVLSSVESPSTGEIRIALRRGSTTVDVHWPVSGANACAQWLREWLH
jgi:transposase